jgi:chemotaxis regulatin CheY-phosphate phosphatase CheZ
VGLTYAAMTKKYSRRKSEKKNAGKKTKRSDQAETTVLACDAMPQLAPALELLLVGLAHGDAERVQSALCSLWEAQRDSSLPIDSSRFLELFHKSVWALRQDFGTPNGNVGAVSLPEVSENLARLRARAEEATKRTLSLIEQQEQLVAHSERLVEDLEALLKSDSFDHNALERELLEWKVLTAAMRRLSVDMLCTQDFEDLCGFILPKVQEFMKGLEGDIRGVLAHLHVSLPEQHSQAQRETSNQSDIDAILKQHGR